MATRQEDVLRLPKKWCEPPHFSHELCTMTKASHCLEPPFYGLSDELIESLQIKAPITPRVAIQNLAYGVNESKLHEVFSMSSRVVQSILFRQEDGQSRGGAIVEYAHPLEAVQAMVMFRDAKLLTKKLVIEPDKIGPPPINIRKNPDRLVDVRGG